MMRMGTILLVVCAACGPGPRHDNGSYGGSAVDASCTYQCSPDQRTLEDCNGNAVAACDPTQVCDAASQACVDACTLAQTQHSSVGCDYYATSMDSYGTGSPQQTLCFAAFVANTSPAPAHIGVDYMGQSLSPASFTRIPNGSGPSLTYDFYDANAGLMPGQVAIVFLGGSLGAAPYGCPAPPAAASPQILGTGLSNSFHITTDVPVVAYQINPYGGGAVAVTGASLLLPTSAWHTNYVAVNVSPMENVGMPLDPSLNIIARDDNTMVTITPTHPIVGGHGVPGGAANQPYQIVLAKGQHVQITQDDELTGSIITSSAPVGFMAGQNCMRIPAGTTFCDHGEQMIPPVRALGSRYIGVMYRPRVATETATFWRLVGAVDGTQLTWSAQVGGPTTIGKGQQMTFLTGQPFVVQSQDKDHPFMLFTYMTSSGYVSSGYGDPDFVVDVPPDQFLSKYVFFTDPTYPETNLVVIRGRGADNAYHDVSLDCLGAIVTWQPIDGNFEYARLDLQTGDFHAVGACSNGRHEIASDAPFGLQVWGWGTPMTTTFTANVSYGYPGGMNVQPINDVIIQ